MYVCAVVCMTRTHTGSGMRVPSHIAVTLQSFQVISKSLYNHPKSYLSHMPSRVRAQQIFVKTSNPARICGVAVRAGATYMHWIIFLVDWLARISINLRVFQMEARMKMLSLARAYIESPECF